MVIKPNVLNQEPLSMTEVAARLKKLSNEKELNFRSARTYEYLKELKLLSKKDADELFKQLQALDIPRMRDNYLKKLVDLLPTTEQEMDIIFYGAPITVKKEDKKKMLEVIKSFAEKV